MSDKRITVSVPAEIEGLPVSADDFAIALYRASAAAAHDGHLATAGFFFQMAEQMTVPEKPFDEAIASVSNEGRTQAAGFMLAAEKDDDQNELWYQMGVKHALGRVSLCVCTRDPKHILQTHELPQ